MTSHAEQYCREKASNSGSSFYYSFLFLSPIQRQAIEAVYAFCREIDDVVDECSDVSLAAIKLAWWGSELDRIYHGTPQHPVGISLKKALHHFPLEKKHFQELLLGMEMDLNHQTFNTFADLRLYCERVASTVGLLAIEIFGYHPDHQVETIEYAKKLGIALQLINIIRDIGEDALKNRIYIPEEDLQLFSVSRDSLIKRQYSDNFTALMHHQTNRARDFYQNALQHLSPIDYKKQKASLIMAKIYFSLLDQIEKSQFQILHQRIALTPLIKLWVAFKCHRQINKSKIKPF